MPRLPVDFSEAEEYGPLPLEDNPFPCQVTDISEVQHSDKGTPYVNAEFTIVDGEHTERRVWRNLPIAGKGAGFFLDFARKVMGDMDLSEEEIVEIPTEDYVGRLVDVVVDHAEYPEGSGEIRNQVARLLIAE